MNVNPYNTKDYERNDIFAVPENKANSNPIKANFRKAKMNVNSLITKDYRKNDAFAVQKNKPNFRKAQMNVTSYITKDYENVPRLRTPGKQTQSKPIPLEAFLRKTENENLELSLIFLSAMFRIFVLSNLCEPAQVLDKPPDNLLRVIKLKCLQI